MKQHKLFKVKKVVKKEGLSKEDSSFKKILEAKRTGDWSNVTDTDFTKYYIRRHNSLYERRLLFNIYTSVTTMREAFRLRYDIPKEEMCSYIEGVLAVYKTDPDCWEYLSFGMINNNIALMDRLVNATKELKAVQSGSKKQGTKLKVSDEYREKNRDKEVF